MANTATAGLTPCPYIALTLTDLHPSCATITAYRVVGTRVSPVRAAIRVDAVGGVNVLDWQAPTGRTVAYRVEQFTADGTSLGYLPTLNGRIDGVTKTWIHNPLDPAGAVAVELGRGTAAEVDQPHDADLARASGHALVTVVSGQRGGVTDSPLVFYTLTDTDRDRVNDLLGDPYTDLTGPPVICIRTPFAFNVPWPAPLIAAVALKQQPVNLHAGLHTTRWIGTVTEAEEPAIALITTVFSYDDLDAAFSSYDDMDAAYATYLDRDRQYQLATLPDPGDGGGSSGFGSGNYGSGAYGA